jgi:hypothetical protein
MASDGGLVCSPSCEPKHGCGGRRQPDPPVRFQKRWQGGGGLRASLICACNGVRARGVCVCVSLWARADASWAGSRMKALDQLQKPGVDDDWVVLEAPLLEPTRASMRRRAGSVQHVAAAEAPIHRQVPGKGAARGKEKHDRERCMGAS